MAERDRTARAADRRRTAALAPLGAGVLAGAAALHGLGDLAARKHTYVALHGGMLVVCGLAALLLWRRARRRDVAIVLAVALAARLVLAFDVPSLSDDSYRFVWDGRVQADGINPYDHAPASERLRDLRDFEIFTEVNRPFTRTVYPPTNELAFLVVNRVAGEGTTQVKLAWLGVEVAAIALLLVLLTRTGRSPGRVALYAWHPLAIVEIAASGHPEPLLVAFTLAGLLLWDERRSVGAGAVVAAAVLTKFAPLLLAPFMARRLGMRFALALAVVAALLYAPYTGAGIEAFGSISEYGQERFGAGLDRWLTGLGVGDAAARALLLGGLGAGVIATVLRPPRDLVRACAYAALLLGGTLLVSRNVQPWYLLWVLPLLCVAPIPGLLWAAGTASFLYAFGEGAALSEGELSTIVWGPCIALLAAGAIRSWWAPRAGAGAPTPAQEVGSATVYFSRLVG
jgi:alpha-1,6-mannosyltransferase